jgi:hypothetical protein
MDKSARKFAGLALGSLCVALVWTTLGSDRPKPVIPIQSPAPRPLLPPPEAKHKAQLAAFTEAYLKYSPELDRVLRGLNDFAGVDGATTDL